MVKKTLVLHTIAFVLSAPCVAMQMDDQQVAHSIKTLDETSAKELIEKLLGKTYDNIVSAVSKLSDAQKESIKLALKKNHALFTHQVRLLQVLSGHTKAVTSVAFSPDGRYALTASSDTTACLWDLTKFPITAQQLKGHTRFINSVAFSPDSRFVLTGSEDGTAVLWDLTKTPITGHMLTTHTHAVTLVAFSPDGRALTHSWDKTVLFWDLTKSPISHQELKGIQNWTTSIAFSPDGRFVLSNSGKNANLWDLTKSPITSQLLAGHNNSVTTVAFSPDGRFALTGSDDKTARRWDLTKSPITSEILISHTNDVLTTTFGSNGRFALTKSIYETSRLWDLTKSPITSALLTSARQEALGHWMGITATAFSHDGCLALTGSLDKTARLWDLTKSPATSLVLTNHTRYITSVAFSPDNRFALTGSWDNSAHLLKIESIDSAALALEDLLLIIKLTEDADTLKDDSKALERLQVIGKTAQQQPLIIKLITDYLYRAKLPEKECWICSEKYDPEARICMQLICCKKTMCKVCLDKLGGMTYSTEFEGYQFQHTVKAKCPFCNKPADQMGTIKKFKIDDPENHHCSSCNKEKCTLQCDACKTEYYCSKECQLKDWPNHKDTCKKKIGNYHG